MKIQRGVLMLMAFLLTVIWVPWSRGETAPASHCAGGPALCGELGPLIPFHKDAIHAGLGWTERKTPKICFWMRPSEYQGIHLVDPLRPPGPGALRTDTFEKFVYGNNFTAGKGFSFSLGPHGLDESLATRIQADLYLDNALCFDLTHPAAFQNSGKFNTPT